MASRLKLHEKFCEILNSRSVYFQPPASVKMQYPAIVYSLSGVGNDHADDEVYLQSLSYEVTLIDRNPDNEFMGKISRLPRCRFDRLFVSDNLYHYVFTIYH